MHDGLARRVNRWGYGLALGVGPGNACQIEAVDGIRQIVVGTIKQILI